MRECCHWIEADGRLGQAIAIAGVWLGFAIATRAVTLPPPWRWSNPSPHGANIVDQATVGSLTVQVGERGQIFLSDDWQTWIPRDSGTHSAFRAATFFGGRLVITGESGSVMFADNPWEFYSLLLGTTDWLEGVAASDRRVVAVGDHASIYTSTNAVNWERVTPGFTNWLRSVAHGNDLFVAVGEGGFVATSVSGSTWQVRSSGTATNLNRVAWLGDRFLAVGEGGEAFSSANGDSWSSVKVGANNALFALAGGTHSHLAGGQFELRLSEDGGNWFSQFDPSLPSPAPSWVYYSALQSGDDSLLVGQTGMLVQGTRSNSTSQTTWQSYDDSVRTWLWQVTRTPTHYVAVGDYGTVLSSPNGIDWDLELAPDAATNSVLLGVGGNSNLCLAVGSRGTILWGTNAFLWHAQAVKPTVNDLQGVCFDGSRFVLTGGNGIILTSPDGSNWMTRATPVNTFLSSVESWPGGLVAVGEDGAILISPNGGTNWMARPSGTTNWLSQVRWLNGILITVGENGTILTSTNATQWEHRTSGTMRWLNAAEFLEDSWFVVGNQGTVLGSPDTVTWTSLGTVTRKSLYGVSVHNGQLVTVGSEGVIIRSQLIPDSTPIRIAEYGRASNLDTFLFTGGTDQKFRLQYSTNLVDWSSGARLEFLDGTGTLLHVEDNGADTVGQRFFRTVREGD